MNLKSLKEQHAMFVNGTASAGQRTDSQTILDLIGLLEGAEETRAGLYSSLSKELRPEETKLLAELATGPRCDGCGHLKSLHWGGYDQELCALDGCPCEYGEMPEVRRARDERQRLEEVAREEERKKQPGYAPPAMAYTGAWFPSGSSNPAAVISAIEDLKTSILKNRPNER